MMDQTDIKLMNIIQKNFPIHPRPYKVIAQEFKISEQEVIERILRMKDEGAIRKIGATFNSNKLGYMSTLCALTVSSERIAEVAQIINSYKGVTHNYIRDHAYNMWFTLTAPSAELLEETLDEIRKKTGISEILNLSAKRTFKINVNFQL